MFFFFFQAEDGIRDGRVTGVQTCALPIFDAAPDLAQQLEIDVLGVVFGIAAIDAVEERSFRSLGAIRDRMQRARGAHKLEDFLADAVHIDGERNSAEANKRYAKFLLAQDLTPSARVIRPHGEIMKRESANRKHFGHSIMVAVSIHTGWKPSRLSTLKICSPCARSRVSTVTSSLAPFAGTSRKSRRCSTPRMLAPSRPSRVAMCPSTPGWSGMVNRNETMRLSRSSSRTMTEARMRASMLPPHRISPTLRPRNFSGSTSMAASPAAPAPSAMVFCSVR